MGESDLLLGPHGEGGTEHRGIGIHGDRARCPLWSSLCAMGGGRTKSPPQSPRIFTEAKAACRRRTDQSLTPTFLADGQAPHTTEAQA
jgi:hypothetical protein